MKMKKTYVLLTRASTAEQGKFGTSHRYQSERIKEGARNMLCLEEVNDTISGTKAERKNLDLLIRKIKLSKTKPDYILVQKWDRFIRNDFAAYSYIEKFENLGVEVNAVEQWIDFSMSNARTLLGVFIGMSADESRKISNRTKDGINQRLREGIYMCGKPPRGYIKVYSEAHRTKILKPSPEFEIIKKIGLEIMEGNYPSLDWLRNKYKDEIKFSKTRFHEQFRKRVLTGMVKVRATKRSVAYEIKGQHQAMFTIYEWEKINEELDKRSRFKKKQTLHERFYLRGFLFDDFGDQLTSSVSKGRSKSYGYYHHSSKPTPRIPEKLAHSIILGVLRGFKLSKKDLHELELKLRTRLKNRKLEINKNVRINETKLNELSININGLAKKLASSKITVEEYREVKSVMDVEKNKVLENLHVLKSQQSTHERMIKKALKEIPKIAKQFVEANAEYKRKILRAFFPEGFKIRLESKQLEPFRINSQILQLFNNQIINNNFLITSSQILTNVPQSTPEGSHLESLYQRDVELFVSILAA